MLLRNVLRVRSVVGSFDSHRPLNLQLSFPLPPESKLVVDLVESGSRLEPEGFHWLSIVRNLLAKVDWVGRLSLLKRVRVRFSLCPDDDIWDSIELFGPQLNWALFCPDRDQQMGMKSLRRCLIADKREVAIVIWVVAFGAIEARDVRWLELSTRVLAFVR